MKTKLFIGFAVLTVAIFVFTRSYSQSQPKHYTVRLYAADKLVGSWEALDWGTVDGQTISFTVGNRSFPTRVRVSGTFSVEEHD